MSCFFALRLGPSRKNKKNNIPWISCFMCNPTTKRFKRLPVSPCDGLSASRVTLISAFEPLSSHHYKVISIYLSDPLENRHSVELYSSKTGSWRELQLAFQLPWRLSRHCCVFVNGAIHWYIHEATSLYFDVDSETLKTMPMPPILSRDDPGLDVLYFGESRGHLRVAVTTDLSSFEFDVLKMTSNYSGWFKKYHVYLQSMTMAFPQLIWNLSDNDTAFSVISVDLGAMSHNFYDGTPNKNCDLVPRQANSHLTAGGYHLFMSNTFTPAVFLCTHLREILRCWNATVKEIKRYDPLALCKKESKPLVCMTLLSKRVGS